MTQKRSFICSLEKTIAPNEDLNLTRPNSSVTEEDEELHLLWAAIERLPTFKRLRTSIFDFNHGNEGRNGKEVEGKRTNDVTKLGAVERHLFIEKLINHIQSDHLLLLQKLRDRIDRVNVKLPTVEVRYKDMSLEGECEIVQGKPLPTLWNCAVSFLSFFTKVVRSKPHETNISILKDVSGVIKPSRLTLLLGPPGSGKTTLLLALSGNLDQSLKLDARVLEAEQKVIIRQAISAEGQKRNLQTDYVLKILGLDVCADIMVGSALREEPAPETFNLFDDVILMAAGKIVYHGPRGHALQFFEDCGFKCPQRKGAADFLQQVISKKDQEQYWCRTDLPYSNVSVDQFCQMFRASYLEEKLDENSLNHMINPIWHLLLEQIRVIQSLHG
ncbi:ATP-binding cassette transporter, putative [Ricinus communis]|uniref:ATP-binding cassette transporter, putative n=1 Tax=Ricinus communis TaxID=3988 RepID=B9RZZ1_RICCO|nr:ATP-binding cassette transporter, putative [Ricinus communis]